MSLFLIRYGELGLKSPKVKKRFQRMLKKNIEDAFLREKTQCLSSMDWGRIYVYSDEDAKAEDILRRIFGITSFSRVIETSADLKEICKTSAEYSKLVIPENGTFAVRAKRTGEHKFSSQDVAKEVGSAILKANEKRALSVNLSDPDIEIFVEARHNRAFIFSKKIPGPGGFPVGSQGKVLTVISDRKSIYAAWLMMKRGCRIKPVCLGEETLIFTGKLEPWYLNTKPIIIGGGYNGIEKALSLIKKTRAEALVLGFTFEEFQKNPYIKVDVPIFYPLIGLDQEGIEKGITFLFGDGS